MSADHTNDGAFKNSWCMAACERQMEVEILWFFEDFSGETAVIDGNGEVQKINRVRSVFNFPSEGSKGIHGLLKLVPIGSVSSRVISRGAPDGKRIINVSSVEQK